MREPKAEIATVRFEESEEPATHVVGEIAAIDERGRASVVFPGNRILPVPARSVVDAPARAGEHPDALIGAPVLLVFEGGDPAKPIILGFVSDVLRPEPARPELRLDLGEERDVVVDGKRIVLEAEQEVLLRCGKGTILMRRDGKVMVRGTDVLSRSTGPNRVKGASVKLN
jgi:hypothetical protein